MIYKLAKTRYRRTLDQEDIVYITDVRKHIITEPVNQTLKMSKMET